MSSISATAKKPLDAHELGLAASQWIDAAERTSELRDLPNGAGKRCLPIQSTVCLAFALELALKALWIQNKKSVEKVHKTAELFDGLPEVQRERLQGQVEVELAKIDDRARFVDEMEKIAGRPLPLDFSERLGKSTFRDRLDYSSNAFVEWRYHFESTVSMMTDPNFLDRLARFALHLLHELRCEAASAVTARRMQE